MNNPLKASPQPELYFGLVAPIGVDLDLVTEVLSENLRRMGYSAQTLRVTNLMRDVPLDIKITSQPYIKSFTDRIAYANKVREALGDDALAALAISAIRTLRAEEWTRRNKKLEQDRQSMAPHFAPSEAIENPSESGDHDRLFEELPVPRQAYIIRQFKRPEEIALLRSVYGRQFIVLSAYSPLDLRQRKLEEAERRSQGGLVSDVDVQTLAINLIAQDAKEGLEKHGQNVRDAFPLGDVFIDASTRSKCEATIQRFVHLLFGSNQITPRRDEYGMYMAKSASLRSSDLSRQVGAAIFLQTGEVATLGSNEVPKAGGGTYWEGDENDHRDFVHGYDPNERQKTELLIDILHRLKAGSHLSPELQEMQDAVLVAQKLLADRSDISVSESKVMDLLEFGRIIHAEMSAICDAARKGISVKDGTLFVTTFPCHICAKHIVASGIKRVVYLEPYPKSYATELHSDAISITENGHGNKVSFEPFIGVSPYRYRDLFEKGKRKYSGGVAQPWNHGEIRPMIEVYFPSYILAEFNVLTKLKDGLEKLPGMTSGQPI
jgi:cytidine deaminase